MKPADKPRDIVFLRVNYLRGPNIWTYRPVIEAWVDIGAFEQAPSNTLTGFTERLLDWLPGLAQHRCGVGEPGGFVQRLRAGTWMAHILEHVTIELQNLAGSKVGFGKARETGDGSGIYKVAVRTRSEEVGRAAIAAGRDLLLAAVADHVVDLPATIARLRDLVDAHCFGPSTACIVDAAVARRIPWISLNGGNLVQLGYGARQRRIWTAETDRSSAIAEGIARDKDMTKSLLAAVGVPVPAGQLADSPAAAWEAAQDIGLPVAVKPVDGNHGRGITLDLRTQADIEAAWPFARRHGSEVMVERFIPGNEHRVLVVNGKVVAAARGESAWITGDGVASVRELIERELNSDPRRGTTEAHPLGLIGGADDTAVITELARQGLDYASVPVVGTRVLISRNGNVAFDCTPEVHPDVAAQLGLAARVIGLDIAGIDLVTPDIGQPLDTQGGAVVEVNAGPGLLMHLRPAGGTAQPVGQAIAAYLFPEGQDGRIPLVCVAGTQDTIDIARLIAWLLRVAGRRVGLACADGIFLDRRQVAHCAAGCFDSAQGLLMNRSVDAAVFAVDSTMILRDGLPFDRCSVAVVTDVQGSAALGEYFIDDDEKLFTVLRGPVDTVLGDGIAVLNADDARVLAMAALADGEVILYAAGADNAAVAAHCAVATARAVLIEDGQVLLRTGAQSSGLDTLAALCGEYTAVQPAALLAGIAAAWGMGLAPELIRAAIKTWAADRAAPHAVPA